MNARRFTGSIALGPEALKILGQTFDDAWQEIAGNFGSDPHEIEAARLMLANAFLAVAHGDLLDPQVFEARRAT
jgi:hypothetical protein